MRIIAGEFRGRKILPPEGEQTRLVTDRVKQSVFDVIAHLMEGSVVYDCFAGTGSFGLEALSRGAKHVTFFESHRPTVRLLRRNIETLKVGNRSTVALADVFESCSKPAENPVDLIFLDPPYRYLRECPADLQRLAKLFAERHLQADGLVVFRHEATDELKLDAVEAFDVRKYGGMTVEWLRRSELLPGPRDD
ncbi:MAG TPA: 16S rRNA (guanine(966)-N(2))-methyltransferase RsmD, partial [Tepidisphaeraceae bacterium]|nr:16S rRNA (guanine(966)-N(2))-methyltransferase RsmD [Tepidisphaeraceae bacterium]